MWLWWSCVSLAVRCGAWCRGEAAAGLERFAYMPKGCPAMIDCLGMVSIEDGHLGWGYPVGVRWCRRVVASTA